MCVPVSVHRKPSEPLLLLFVTWKLKRGHSDWQIAALSFLLACSSFKAQGKWKVTYRFLEKHYYWNDYKTEQSSSAIRVDRYTCVHWFSAGMKCNRLKNGKCLQELKRTKRDALCQRDLTAACQRQGKYLEGPFCSSSPPPSTFCPRKYFLCGEISSPFLCSRAHAEKKNILLQAAIVLGLSVAILKPQSSI